MSAPLIFIAAHVRREEDRFWHSVRMGVPGVVHTEMIVTVESEGYDFPRIAEVDQFGSLKVDPQIQEQLVLAVFPRLMKKMLQYGGSEVALQLGDVTSLVRNQLNTPDGDALLAAIHEVIPDDKAFNDGFSVTTD